MPLIWEDRRILIDYVYVTMEILYCYVLEIMFISGATQKNAMFVIVQIVYICTCFTGSSPEELCM